MKKINFLLICFFSLMILSCGEIVDNNEINRTLQVSLSQKRLISPSIDSGYSWELSLWKTGTAGSDINTNKVPVLSENGSTWTFSSLERGDYKVKASGKKSQPDGSSKEFFIGEAPVKIGDELVTRVVVPISAVKNTETSVGLGHVNISLGISTELRAAIDSLGRGDALTIQLNNLDTSGESYLHRIEHNGGESVISQDKIEISEFALNTPDVTSPPSPDLNCGYYRLGIRISNSTDGIFQLVLKDSNVEVGNGLTTNIVINASDYELRKTYTAVYVNNAGSGDGSVYSKPKAFNTIQDYQDQSVVSKIYYLLEDISNPGSAGLQEGSILKPFGKNPVTITGTSGNVPSFSDVNLDNIILAGQGFDLGAKISGNVTLNYTSNGSMNYTSLLETGKITIGPKLSAKINLILYEKAGGWKAGERVVFLSEGNTSLPTGAKIDLFDIDFNLSKDFYLDSTGCLAEYVNNPIEVTQNPFKLAFSPAVTGTPAFTENDSVAVEIENFDDYIDETTGRLKTGISVDWYLNDQKVIGLDLVSYEKLFNINPLSGLKVQDAQGVETSANIYMRDNILMAYITIDGKIFNPSIRFDKKIQ